MKNTRFIKGDMESEIFQIENGAHVSYPREMEMNEEEVFWHNSRDLREWIWNDD